MPRRTAAAAPGPTGTTRSCAPAKVEGNVGILKELASLMVDFDRRFEIMPGTKGRTVVAHEDPYEADSRHSIAE
jgi:hypothetical protein